MYSSITMNVCKGFLNFTCWTAVLVKQSVSSCQWKQTSSSGLWLANLAAVMGCQLLQWSNSNPFPWRLNFPVKSDSVNWPQIRFQIPIVLKVTIAGSLYKTSWWAASLYGFSPGSPGRTVYSCLFSSQPSDMKMGLEEITSVL